MLDALQQFDAPKVFIGHEQFKNLRENLHIRYQIWKHKTD